MRIRTLPTPELGNRSYVVDDGTVSVVIDPQRDLDRLEPILDVDPAYVLETHVHNDYVTGGLALARYTGASYGVNGADEVDFDRLPLADGQILRAGSLEVAVLATPGHTPTHLSYVVRDTSDPDGAPVLFSGGSLLYGTVGRTDLIAPEATHDLTVAQYRSAQRLAALDPATRLYPTHGFGSFCSAAVGAGGDSSTIGAELLGNVALTAVSEEAFVKELVESLSAYPSYYAHMAPLNRHGPAAADLDPALRAVGPEALAALIAAGATVVDLRAAAEFAAEHLAGTVSVNLGTQFASYVGWLAPWRAPLAVIGAEEEHLRQARRQLVRIGIEETAWAWGPLAQLVPSDVERRAYPRVRFDDFAPAAGDTLLDVRRREEYVAGHVRGARHLPLHELAARHGELPHARTWVYCAGGFRAGTAASILDGLGFDVVHIDDGFDRAVALGLTAGPAGVSSR